MAHVFRECPKNAIVCSASLAALSCYCSITAIKSAATAVVQFYGDPQLLGSNAVQAAELESAAFALMNSCDEKHPGTSALDKADTTVADASVGRVVCSCIGASTAELKELLAPAVLDAAAGDRDADTASHDGNSSSSSSSSADIVLALISDGEAAYRSDNFEEAVKMFRAALRQLQQGPTAAASTLLSNQAACLLQLNKHLGQAAVIAVAAAIIGGAGASQTKALYRAASAMLQLKLLPAAAAVCDLELSTAPEEQAAAMHELQQRIRKQQQQGAAKASNKGSSSAAAEAGATGSSSSTRNRGRQSSAGAKALTEREAERFMSAAAGGSAGLQQMAAMNAAASMAAATGRGRSWMTGPDKRVPAFHEEYMKAKRCELVSITRSRGFMGCIP
jgi:hypothetical protein